MEATSRLCEWFEMNVSPHTVTEARNRSVRRMLELGATHLFSVDDDVHIPPDTLEKLLSLDCNVAVAPVPVRRKNALVSLNVGTEWSDDKEDVYWVTDWFDGVKEAKVIGTGCVLIKREVFETLEFPWFRWPTDHEYDPKSLSDDVDFSMKVIGSGLGPMLVHGSVHCGHFKEIDLVEFVGA